MPVPGRCRAIEPAHEPCPAWSADAACAASKEVIASMLTAPGWKTNLASDLIEEGAPFFFKDGGQAETGGLTALLC